ncbi:prephenate dehydrogenase [Aureibaculum sp. 2210JD6-5]|uniref:prephenate dehydrogenase n=1 Tax=Aureibaculum sp. 2210JD6-5 TaxID=3103957 RepID=UPI002AAD752D|nr:prephenate dehydrogenase [Aureibaculum sp. 2210JD6-5]MDY7396515.1 prephenate dehydrogenase [Aureibaculum sp. 2210JD6-5]
MEKIVVIGLGLIGGSLAIDLKKNGNRHIIGLDKNENHTEKALELNIVDAAGTENDIATADIVIVAVPADAIPAVTKMVLDRISDNALVFDVGSVKGQVCSQIKNHPNRKNYVAVHPIAGTEFSGPEAAFSGLFTNKINIICEKKASDKKILEKALQVFDELQMRITFMNADEHDKHIAYVSHLSHISAFMLGKTVLEIEPNEKNIFNMAGSGFRSTVRLAKSSPAMWTPIFLQNKENILKSLNEYIKNLETFKTKIEEGSNEEVFEIMENTNRIKNILDGIVK